MCRCCLGLGFFRVWSVDSSHLSTHVEVDLQKHGLPPSPMSVHPPLISHFFPFLTFFTSCIDIGLLSLMPWCGMGQRY
jgi:hypothetical protein